MSPAKAGCDDKHHHAGGKGFKNVVVRRYFGGARFEKYPMLLEGQRWFTTQIPQFVCMYFITRDWSEGLSRPNILKLPPRQMEVAYHQAQLFLPSPTIVVALIA